MDRAEPYEGKLAQAQAAVKRARNDQAHVPINSLPEEILTQIFYLVSLNGEHCPLRTIHRWNSEKNPYFPAYPDIFSHVCSRWRQITLDCPKLWSHIDIALSCLRSHGLHNRAVVHASRARQIPLDIHFVDPAWIGQAERHLGLDNDSEDEDDEFDPDTLIRRAEEGRRYWVWEDNPSAFTFLTSPVSRIRSLELIVHDNYHPIYSRALEHCLANCLPGGLFKLVINIELTPQVSFFKVAANLEYRAMPELVLPEQQLERALLSITVLNLRKMYFPWTSAAYHGLTDLRLLGREQISVSDLTGILRSSPMLRIIHCDFRILGSPTSDTPTIPVALPEIEVLGLEAMHVQDTGRFLELINPGPKPLRLLFSDNPTSTVLQAFFARSNVQELLIAAGWALSEVRLPPEAFCLPLQLQVLAMNNWEWDSSTEHKEGTPPAQLDTVYMVGCLYQNADLFRKAVAHLSPRRLVLWKCTIGDHEEQKSSLAVFESALGKDLCQTCSIEHLTDQDPNPLTVQDWN